MPKKPKMPYMIEHKEAPARNTIEALGKNPLDFVDLNFGFAMLCQEKRNEIIQVKYGNNEEATMT